MLERDDIRVYRTLDELLKADIVDMYEYESSYYIRIKPTSFYDESMWKVNKITGKVSCVHFVETLSIPGNARTPIDPKNLRMRGNTKG